MPFVRYKLSETSAVTRALLEGRTNTKSMAGGNLLQALSPLGREGVVALAAAAAEGWDLEDAALPLGLAARGLDGSDKLPDFPYRDDGLLVWCAIQDFVDAYVRVYYPPSPSHGGEGAGVDAGGDARVLADQELQRWFQRAVGCGFPAMQREEGVPPAINTTQELSGVLSTLIWLCTAYTHAVVGGLYEGAALVPDRPMHLRRAAFETKPEPPPPLPGGEGASDTAKGFGETDFLDFMPSKAATASSVAVLRALSQAPTSAATSGTSSGAVGGGLGGPCPLALPEDFLLRTYISDPEALVSVAQYERNMRRIECIVAKRNEGREEPYHSMRPALMGCGVAIDRFEPLE